MGDMHRRADAIAVDLVAGCGGDLREAERRTLHVIQCLPLQSSWLPKYREILHMIRERRV